MEECCYPVSLMLNVMYSECRKLALYADSHYADCHYADCHYAECRYVKLLGPGVNLIKLFWHKFTHVFCKLDHCINANIIFLCCEKI